MHRVLRELDRRYRLRARVEDHILTRPNPFYSSPIATPLDESRHRALLDELVRNGAIILEDIVPAEHIAGLRAAIEEVLGGQRPDIPFEVMAVGGSCVIRSNLRPYRPLAEIAADPRVTRLVEDYFHRHAVLADMDIRRDPPADMDELMRQSPEERAGYTSNHWHRDHRGRQVKLLVYLTDVGPSDNNFAYLPTSHIGHHGRGTFQESRIPEDFVAGFGKTPVEAYAKAGTGLLFDTNIVHRLRRKATASARDTVTFYYTPGQNLRQIAGIEVARQATDDAPVFMRSH